LLLQCFDLGFERFHLFLLLLNLCRLFCCFGRIVFGATLLAAGARRDCICLGCLSTNKLPVTLVFCFFCSYLGFLQRFLRVVQGGGGRLELKFERIKVFECRVELRLYTGGRGVLYSFTLKLR
jgi:TRAP-type C4-dicarboxylate transport system permease small subunit